MRSKTTSDMLSALLDKGTKLKEAMIKSSMDTNLKPSRSNPDLSTISSIDTDAALDISKTSKRLVELFKD
jgi:hypothetical protein